MHQNHSDKELVFYYQFWMSNNIKREFVLRVDSETLLLKSEPHANPPQWTRLDFFRCENCTLEQGVNPHCPVALNLIDLIEFFRLVPSHEDADVCVVTQERKYVKRMAAQFIISSLMGIIMASSGCPVLGKMKPLLRAHIPFPSAEENVFRIMSLYLLEQYIALRKGHVPDWDMKGLTGYLGEIETVNEWFCKRLNAVKDEGGDACLNAVNNLNNLSILTKLAIEEDDLVADAIYSEMPWVNVPK
jgi:hypothetical protein